MKKIKYMIAAALVLFIIQVYAEEGMYPVSEISKLDLQNKGLKISSLDIYNPNGISIVNGICKVGGASGSFISEKGLIITNHHVAYGAIQGASTPEHDYISQGFYAPARDKEIPAKGYVVRITESYKDVSKEVLSAVKPGMTFQEQAEAIDKRIKKLVKKAEKKHKGKRAEISEMFPGKTYVLFLYTYLRDIRLVYAPPRSIGNFGGEIDNWMWPRHTGDFSILRAYVSPDGKPSEYSGDNIPFKPKKVLKIDPAGVKENDFVFILGYPGRTYRNRTSYFLEYQYKYRMPWIADYYQWEIDLAEKMSAKDRGVAIKLATKIKWRSNTMKNYRGKLEGIKRLNLVDKKRNEEKALQEFIENHEKLKKYSGLLAEIKEIYTEISENSDRELILRYLRSSPFIVSMAFTVYEGSKELKKPDIERKSAYMNRNIKRTEKSIERGFNNFYEPADKAILKKLLLKAADLPENKKISAVEKIIKGKDKTSAVNDFVENLYAGTNLKSFNAVLKALYGNPLKDKIFNDPAILFVSQIYEEYENLEKIGKEREGKLDKLLASLLDVKKKFKKTAFIPDANGTLRFTYGRIEGYSPRDAVFYKPFTTVQGIEEKSTGKFPFDAPEKLIGMINSGRFKSFIQPDIKTVPVDMLYSTDTTGGNSGSPIFNAQGNLVGINFDRAYGATINDFAWSRDYSRSIGVDIRYVLWILKDFSKAESIIKELNL